MSRGVLGTSRTACQSTNILLKRNIQQSAARSPQEPNFYTLQLPLVVAGIVDYYPKEEEFSQTMSLQQNAWSRPALPAARFTSSHPSARNESVSHNWKSWYDNLEPVDISVNQNERYNNRKRKMELLKMIQQDEYTRTILSALLIQDKQGQAL
jgi:hypothetical protein